MKDSIHYRMAEDISRVTGDDGSLDILIGSLEELRDILKSCAANNERYTETDIRRELAKGPLYRPERRALVTDMAGEDAEMAGLLKSAAERVNSLQEMAARVVLDCKALSSDLRERHDLTVSRQEQMPPELDLGRRKEREEPCREER